MTAWNRGQSSIDLLLALVVALVFFAALMAYNQNLANNTTDNSTMNGLKSIRLDVYTAVASAKASGTTITYTSPLLRLAESQAPAPCTITIEIGASKSIKVSSGAKSVSFTAIDTDMITVKKPDGSNVSGPFNCGQKVVISG